jgi:outer membrane protein, multidrug efflux system
MKPFPIMKTILTCFSAAGLLMAGCAVGPNYSRPTALGTNAMPAAFTGATSTNTGQWKLAQPSANQPRGTWWNVFGDSELNRLECQATTNNQQLAAAIANFQQARALVNISKAGYFPQLSATPGFNRQRTSANQFSRGAVAGSSSTFNTFSVPLDASWELDLWGRVRRTVEGSRARMAAAEDDLESLKLTIQAEVAIDYFTLKSQDAQYRLFQETAVTYRRSLELTQNRRKSGIATDLDVSQAETQLRSAEAQIPAIDLQRTNLRHALATLCGQAAMTFKLPETTNAISVFNLPAELPSELLEHRPDIAAAERRMAAANADVGVAYGAFFPSVTLNGLAGFEAVDAGSLFNWDSRLWSVGPSLALPLFTGGRNRAQLASTRAAYDATVANYRQTVLSAFQDVEDQLAAQRLLTQQYDAENAALIAARRTLEISLSRYKGGVITYLEVATAQSIALSHDQAVVQLNAARLNASVSLIKALGAGWTVQPGPLSQQSKKTATPGKKP